MNIDFLKSSRAVALGRLSRLEIKVRLNEAEQNALDSLQLHIKTCDKIIKKIEDTDSPKHLNPKNQRK